MSRLAKKTIPISGAQITQEDGIITFKGVKGELKLKLMPGIKVSVEADAVKVEAERVDKQSAANVGTTWSLIQNNIAGVSSGFIKVLELEGVGYRASMEGKTLILNLGFVNPVRYTPPEGVDIKVEKNLVTVSGPDKERVGQAAASIRAFKKPEPYKGKGIHYKGEIIKRKVGKKAAAAAA